MELRRFARGSLIYGTGSILNRFLTFALLPLFTRYLRPEDYGTIAMLGVLTMLLTGVFSLGIGNSIGVCYFGSEDRDARRRIVWSTAMLMVGNTAVLYGIGFITAPHLSQLLFGHENSAHLIRISLAALAANNLMWPFHSYLRMAERARTFVGLTVFSTIVTATLAVIAVVFMGRGVEGMLAAGALSATATLLLTIIVVSRSLPPAFDYAWVPQLVRIGYPSIFGVGAFFLIDWSDRFLLQRLSGTSELGLYSVGYSFGLAMAFVAEGAFGTSWPPFFNSFVERRDEAVKLFGAIFKYVSVTLGLVALLMFVLARPVVALITAPEYHGVYTVVGLVASAYVLKVCYLLMLPGMVFARKLHLQTGIEWSAAILNIGLNLLLIPRFGMEGAAVATLLAYVSLPVLTHVVGQRYLPVEYDWKRIRVFAAGFAVVACASLVVLSDVLWIDTMIKLAMFLVFCSFSLRFVLSNEDKIALGHMLNRGALKEA